jgi:hypothetical protein
MTGTPLRRASDEAAFSTRFDRGGSWLVALLPIILVAGLLVVRATALDPRRSAFAGAVAEPAELLAAAADRLETATSSGGNGFTFEIVQTATIVARPGGPLVDIPDPVDPHKSLGSAESYPLSTYLEHGVVTPAGFWSEIRRGPEAPDGEPDFTGGPLELAALVRDGQTYRTEGQGWYPTTKPPGLGLDPATAALLPRLLRNATAAREVPVQPRDGVPATRALEATAAVADMPGIIAVDLAASTELREPTELAFDDAGRLVGLIVSARNTNLADFDLMIVTTISLGYPGQAPELPRPEPVYVAPATPLAED